MDDEAERAAYANADVPVRHCQVCPALIPYRDRADKRFCSTRCRSAALNGRRRVERLRRAAREATR
jgi:predicted nucleic acid-binding Zn ribbon protein